MTFRLLPKGSAVNAAIGISLLYYVVSTVPLSAAESSLSGSLPGRLSRLSGPPAVSQDIHGASRLAPWISAYMAGAR